MKTSSLRYVLKSFTSALSVLALVTLAASSGLSSGGALAQTGSGEVRIETQTSGVQTRVINLPKGRSMMVDLPVDASDVFVTNPKVADAVLRTPRRIFVMGVDVGQSDAVFLDRMGKQILSLSIRVEAGTDQIASVIAKLYPQAKVSLQALNNHIILSGMVANNAEASAIARLAATYVQSPDNVVNLLSIAGKDQVMIKVRVVEVNRSAVKQLGFSFQNVNATGGGTGAWTAAQTPSYGVNQQAQGGFNLGRASCKGSGNLSPNFGINNLVCSAVSEYTFNSIQAFERAGLLRTLAEPNVTAVSGEFAKFLAGGEYPVPTGRDTTGQVTIEFKPFGVGLGFTPVVMSNGRISLKVSTEVSELTSEGAVNIAGTSVLALKVRRAESTVELASGASIMMGGLLINRYGQSIDSLPGLGALPVIGTLFRSRDFLNDQSELVVILTAYIVEPTSPDALQTPADNLAAANDIEAIFLGRLNSASKTKKGAKTDTPLANAYQAPIGYVIE
jgi:pilus assembly protein CpaC